jgi:hypothetical protein
MKKNLILLFACIGLATLAYFVEERGEIDRKAKKEKETRIFDMQKYGELKSFETKRAHLTFKKQQAFIKKSNNPVDSKKMSFAFDILSKIRLVRILDNNEVTKKNRRFFFPTEDDYMIFQFSLRKVKYLIGKKIATQRSFYMEIKKDNQIYHVIAHNPSDVKVALAKEKTNQDDTHYRELKSILGLGDPFFQDMHVFNKTQLAKTSEIFFQNKRNRPFRLNLENGYTIPTPPQNVKLNKKKSFDYLENLARVEAIKIYKTFHPSEYYNQLAHISFLDKDQKKWSMKLYSEYNEVKGYYLLLNEVLFEIDKKNINLFMVNSQDFWTKSFTLPAYANAKLQFANEEAVRIQIKDKNKFEVESTDSSKRISHKEFQKIYNFLKTEADFISESDKDAFRGEVRQLLRLEFEKLELSILKTRGEIIVHDKSNNLEYHYLTGDKIPFSTNSEEVIIK